MCENNPPRDLLITGSSLVATGNGTIVAELTVRLGSGGLRFGLEGGDVAFRGLLCRLRGDVD